MWCRSIRAFAILTLAASSVELVAPRYAAAETLPAALYKAYQNNPQLNAQRAYVRQSDEQVNAATAGYLPRVEASAATGPRYTDSRFRETSVQRNERLTTNTVGVTASQLLFDGFRTPNQVSAAEGKARSAREVLRLMTQQVLLDAATAYANTIRDAAMAQLQRHNVEMLQEQLKQAKQRLVLREVTTTDVSQAETRLAGARWQRLAAESALTASRAAYRRVIGEEPSDPLMPATPADAILPQNPKEGVEVGLAENPQIIAAQLGLDVAAIQVKIAEGALYPTAKLDVGAQYGWDVTSQINRQLSAGAFVTLSVPLYQGGAEWASIRESKEAVSQKRFDLDRVRDVVRAGVVEAWAQFAAAKAQIDAAQAQVMAAESALSGVMEETRAGQRTTLDLLNAQQEAVSARMIVVTTQRDRVVTSYNVLAAVGRLSPENLRLSTVAAAPKRLQR
jgi:outer membrane protein